MFFSKVFFGIFVTVLSYYEVNGQFSTNYCDRNLCPDRSGAKPYLDHIGCNNNGKLGPNCPPEAQILDLTPFKDYILQLHNEYRNEVASGRAIGSGDVTFPGATNMPVLKWDNELAHLAGLNPKTCVWGHDECRTTAKFTYSGQNLGKIGTSGSLNSKIHKELISKIIFNWYNEIGVVQLSDLKSYPKTTTRIIGHLTAMMQDKSRYIGCGAVTYPMIGKSGTVLNNVHMACNYEHSNMEEAPVYKMGPLSCKAHSLYTSLCA